MPEEPFFGTLLGQTGAHTLHVAGLVQTVDEQGDDAHEEDHRGDQVHGDVDALLNLGVISTPP